VSAKVRTLSPKAATALVVVGCLVVLLAGVFALVMPQRHKASQLTKEVASTQAQIVTARALAAQKPEQKIRVADLFKVVKAMPDAPDMTGIILQLQQTASDAGVEFDSISPQTAAPGTGYAVQPIDLSFNGNFYALTDFLFRLRKLVTVHHGALNSTGRLFSVDTIAFGAGAAGFPEIAANVHVNAFVYSPAAAVSTSVPPTTTDTTQTATTASPAVASGVTP
jgi:Tfp pilus assembly protein PilO